MLQFLLLAWQFCIFNQTRSFTNFSYKNKRTLKASTRRPETHRLSSSEQHRWWYAATVVNNMLSSLETVNSFSIKASSIFLNLWMQNKITLLSPPRLPPTTAIHMEWQCDPFTVLFLLSFFVTWIQRSLSLLIRKITCPSLQNSESLQGTD